MSAGPSTTRHRPSLWLTLMNSVSGPGDPGIVSTAHAEQVAKEYSTHWNDEKAGFSTKEDEDAVNKSACCISYPAGRGASKRRHYSYSITSDLGKRVKPADFLQPRSASIQDMKRSTATRIASSDLITCEGNQENQFGDSSSDKVSILKTARSRIGQLPPDYWSAFTRDIVSLSIKQHQLVCSYTVSRTHLAQDASGQYARMGRQWHNLEGFRKSSAARYTLITATHATGSDDSRQRSSATTHAQGSTSGDGLIARSGNHTSAQTTGLGVGDDGEDPDDHNERFKILRGHEMDTADGGRQLMLDVCARFHQQSHSQSAEDSESSMREGQGKPKYGRGRSCSSSNRATQTFTLSLAQRSGSAPAQTQYPQRVDMGGPIPENITPPHHRDQDLQQALMCRSRMVRASDITGEPTVDVPWVHHMRPSALLQLRRAAEGYGGYGGLVNLPDADTPSRAQNECMTPETPMGPCGNDAMNNQTARNRDSFSFISSVSSIAQHVDLAEEAVEQPDAGGLPHDQHSTISQHTALAEGPPEELICTYALQNRGLLEALIGPTTTEMETSTQVECSKPRRPSVPQMTPQIPSDSSSADDLSTHKKFRTGSIRNSIRARYKERRRQGSSWSSVLCCLGKTEHDRQSSPESERCSSEAAHTEKPNPQHPTQDLNTEGSHGEGRQDSSPGQTPIRTDVVQEACGRTSDRDSAVIDPPAAFDRSTESASDPRLTWS